MVGIKILLLTITKDHSNLTAEMVSAPLQTIPAN